MKVFVDTDSDIRLARRLRRDITDRGRDIDGVLKQYNTFVKPAFDHYIAPTTVHADIIVPRGKLVRSLHRALHRPHRPNASGNTVYVHGARYMYFTCLRYLCTSKFSDRNSLC